MKKLVLLFFLFLFGNSYSQQSITASGGNATGAGGSASYSVGQIAYSSYSGSGGSVNEGLQHSYEVFLLVNNHFLDKNEITLYPNPTIHQLFLSIKDVNEELSYGLVNITGETLLEDKIKKEITTINVENLPGGIYVLTVFSKNRTNYLSYKIIKNN